MLDGGIQEEISVLKLVDRVFENLGLSIRPARFSRAKLPKAVLESDLQSRVLPEEGLPLQNSPSRKRLTASRQLELYIAGHL